MYRSSPNERKLRRRRKDQSPSSTRGGAFVENLEGRRLLASVVNLTLVDAASDRDIMQLTNGQTINLQNLPSRQLNVRANVDGSTGSVRFGLDGNSNYRVESGAPLALAGDNAGNYNAMTFDAGEHDLIVTPFSGKSATGTAGAALNVSFNVIDQATPTTPAAPTGLTASAASASQVNLSWTDASNNESGFFVERSSDGGQTFARAATLGANVKSWSDTGRAESTTYHYRVLAYNASGSSSASNTASATTPAVTPQPQPTDPKVTGLMLVNADTDQDIMLLQEGQTLDVAKLGTRNLNVRAVTANAQSVRFGLGSNSNYRVESGQPFALAGDDGGNYRAWTPADGTYTLTATPYAAQSGTGTAGAAASVRFTVAPGETDPQPQPTIPAAPTGLTASATSSSQVSLAWADASNNESGFKIERSTDGTNFTQVATVAANAKSYSATGLNASTRYFFRVRATNTAGDSAYSNVANATTQSVPTNPGEWPDASNTGPNNRSILQVQSGSISTTHDGQVIENVHLKGGSIFVNHNNVTIRNFIIENPSTTGAAIKFASNDLTGGKIQYGEIFGGNATNGVSGSGYHAYRLHIYNMQADCFRVKKDVTIEECYLHNFGIHPDAHGDGVQMYPTDGGNMRILNNRIDARGGNAALFQVDNGWHIEGNWFSGGNYTIQATGQSSNKFINNTWDGSGPVGTSKYGPIRIGAGDRDAMGAWTGNKWEDSGATINL